MEKKKKGRRPVPEPRIVQKQVRWTEKEWDIICALAQKINISPTEYIRRKVFQQGGCKMQCKEYKERRWKDGQREKKEVGQVTICSKEDLMDWAYARLEMVIPDGVQILTPNKLAGFQEAFAERRESVEEVTGLFEGGEQIVLYDEENDLVEKSFNFNETPYCVDYDTRNFELVQ